LPFRIFPIRDGWAHPAVANLARAPERSWEIHRHAYVDVLLIEPDEGDCALLQHALAMTLPGVRLEIVCDAASFGAIQGFARFALVITCWKLPWTNGRTVVRLVKGESPSCPVLVISEPMPFLLDFVDVVRATGADRYAAKSAAMEKVSEAAQALLRP
jgi:DNA-binding response OmpR family regulator